MRHVDMRPIVELVRQQVMKRGRGILLYIATGEEKPDLLYITLANWERQPPPGYEDDQEILQLLRTYDHHTSFIVIWAIGDETGGWAQYEHLDYPPDARPVFSA